jgi:hypothetical protein
MINRSKYLVLFCILITINAFAIGPDVTRKTLELDEFQGIYVNSNYTVYLKQSNKQEVTVEVLSEIYSISEFKVENGILHINVKQKKEDPNASVWSKIDNIKIAPTMNVYISVRDINQLKVNGSGKIIGENSIASNNLDLGVSGSGAINIDVKGRMLNTKISGSGSMILKGYASNNIIDISGPGSLYAFDCEIENAQAALSGSGNCEINVSDELEAVVYGSGILKHKGQTKNVVKKVYGKGEVDRAY